MNLDDEKNRTLTSTDIYSIIDFTVQAAVDNGFMNAFVFERALYCFAAIRIYPDRKDEIAKLIADSPMVAWDTLLDDGTIDKMIDDYSLDLDLLAEYGRQWFNDFTKYSNSARGLFNLIQEFSGDIVQQAAQQLQTMSSNGQVQEALSIADNWGMNRVSQPNDDDALFVG